MALAGLYSAMRLTGGTLAQQRVLFLGAGEAAHRHRRSHRFAISLPPAWPAAEARSHCWLFDSKGLVVAGRGELAPHKQPYAHEHAPQSDFARGDSSPQADRADRRGRLRRRLHARSARHDGELNRRPIVFALSNPTSKAECTAQQAYEWSDGRALFACGSPFDPVTWGGATFVPRQGNNSYIFPGLGLGAVAGKRAASPTRCSSPRRACWPSR